MAKTAQQARTAGSETGEMDTLGASEDDAGGVQAVDTAVRVLSALGDSPGPLMLKTVAERAQMSPPKAHRYLVSFCRNGLAERDVGSGGYRLGPLAVRLGLTALRHLDVVQAAAPALVELRDELGFTAGLAIWGSAGPTFVRFEENRDALILSGRPGSVMPLLTSSTGRLFGAFLPRSLTRPFIERELACWPKTGAGAARPVRPRPPQIEQLFAQIRQAGMSWVHGEVNPGIHALSAPIFEHMGAIVGAISLLGPPGVFDSSLGGRNASVLAGRAREVSHRLGWAPS